MVWCTPLVGKVLGSLRYLDVALAAEDSIGYQRSSRSLHEVRIIQLKLNLDELDAGAAAIILLAVLDGFKDKEVGSTCCVQDDIPFSIMP